MVAPSQILGACVVSWDANVRVVGHARDARGRPKVREEEVTVAAGTFAARHFQVVDTAGNLPEEHPPYDVWVTADDDYLLLKAAVAGYMQTYYELVELRRE